jgi:DNA mismatch repair protein MutS2
LHGHCRAFELSREALYECDTRFAQAQLASALDAAIPEFSSHEILLREVRHPLLLLRSEDVIANNVDLSEQKRILLLSGPNAGGKTVLLKAIGLAAHMARCGLPIAASEGSKLPFFTNILVSVGDSQSVDAHLSTFAAHLKVLDQATKLTGDSTLLLIDEICGSTDPEEGTALARSFIEEYAQHGVFGVITSHLGPLKLGWREGSGVVNGSLEYEMTTGRPTYQFLMGIPGQSLAIQTAKRVGVATPIIERAFQYLRPELKMYQESLQQVEDMKTEIHTLTLQLHEQTKEARAQKNKYQMLVQKFEREREKMLEQSVKRAEKKFETLIEHARVDEAFKRHDTLERMKAQLPEIVKSTSKPAMGLQRVESPEDFSRIFPPGSKVFVPSIGRDGVVQGLPSGKGEVPILSASMRLMVPWQNLKAPNQSQNPTIDLLRKTKHFSAPAHSGDRVIDVRGKTIDEALSELEIQLDTAAANEEERIKIIHGHGTETLKRSIRSYLSRSVYVKKWQAGTTETGGDGVTWIEL